MPFTTDWIYFVYVEDERYDFFVAKEKLDGSELHSVSLGYSEALDGYVHPVLGYS